MNLFKRLFYKGSDEEKLKNVLSTIKEVNKSIANMGNWQKEHPSKDIFMKALSEIEDIKDCSSISAETKERLENYQKTCCQAIVAILHSEGLVPFQAGDYQKAFEIVDNLRSLIVKYCEVFEIERIKLKTFIEDIKQDFNNNPNEINPKLLNPMRLKYQKVARDIFANKISSTFVEMLVDAVVVAIICKAMIRNKP